MKAALLLFGTFLFLLGSDARFEIGFPLVIAAWVSSLRYLAGRQTWEHAGETRWLLGPFITCSGSVAHHGAWVGSLNLAASAALGCLLLERLEAETSLSPLRLARVSLGTWPMFSLRARSTAHSSPASCC